jgi:pyruvate/2-oxoglutarate dehydrogenase complex dihydrolipoamide acyltransferase (E2) component
MIQATAPPPAVFESLRAMLVRLVMDLGGRISWGRITRPEFNLVNRRLQDILHRLDSLVARLRAGTYKPRRPGRPRARASPRPRSQPPPGTPAQTFGWLLPLIPATRGEYWHANGLRGCLELQLTHPEMVALIEAAPAAMGRPLRSLCWMFGLRPPPSLAPPRPAAAEAAPPPPAPEAAAPPAPAAAPPAPPPPPHAAAAPPAGACGPPNPA